MLLGAKNIPEIQRLFDSDAGGIYGKIGNAEITLSVLLYLALTHRSAKNAGNLKLAREIEKLQSPGLQSGIQCLERRENQISPEPFGSPTFDLYRINSKSDLLSHEWSLFYDRFRRSAANGRRSDMYRAVGGVLGEMGDNVVWHAFESANKPCLALAGFYVCDGVASFCVADSGQGYLKSLRRNPAWSSLQSDNDALDAVVNKHATSRIGENEGGGFKDLFGSLLDFNGCVFLRSGGSFYQLENSGETRRLTSRASTHVAGSSITVIVSPQSDPIEIPLKIS